MPSNSFVIPFEHLPATLPIFPLPNAIVMPGCHLPLNIFEPRYLDMIFDALKEDRLIGMVQPDTSDANDAHVYGTGTAGRIVSFNEIPDGRLIVVLAGSAGSISWMRLFNPAGHTAKSSWTGVVSGMITKHPAKRRDSTAVA